MYQLKSPSKLGQALRILLVCTGIVGLLVDLLVASYLRKHQFVMHIPARDQLGPRPNFTYTGSPLFGLLWLPSAVSYATIIVWLIWQHRATTNLWARGYAGLHISPGWAVAWWFIPFANLGMPLVAMLELDRRSTPDGVPRKASPLLGWWWAAWIGQQMLPAIAIATVSISEFVRIAQQIDNNTTTLDLTRIAHGAAPWLGVAGALQVVAAVLAFFVVERIDQAQERVFAVALAAPPRPDIQ